MPGRRSDFDAGTRKRNAERDDSRTLYAHFREVADASRYSRLRCRAAAPPADSTRLQSPGVRYARGWRTTFCGPDLCYATGRAQLADSPGDSSPGGSPSGGAPPPNQPAGNVAYNSIDGQASASDPLGMANVDPFGPMFYLNGYFGDSPGWTGPSYQADLYYPWHIVPGRSVFFGVLQAADRRLRQGLFQQPASVIVNISPTRTGSWARGDGWTGMIRRPPDWLRLGGSLESLGKYLDVRANWYVLADQGSDTLSQGFTGSPFFQGYNIVLNQPNAHRGLRLTASTWNLAVGFPSWDATAFRDTSDRITCIATRRGAIGASRDGSTWPSPTLARSTSRCSTTTSSPRRRSSTFRWRCLTAFQPSGSSRSQSSIA